ncbi:hypothetical protein BD626DRAFT_218765 [Schizophyllum amplum]|uniref:Uncharacterized protein n=1 Tax=Schizophyllum amplum TaxID=97359 RepID=A0A550CKV1_9AGAR|nr:hypothetical protein BD626DRAFT_218765 [Auriculariopsis ampla]
METYQHCGVHRNVGASLDDYAFRDHLNLKEGSSEDGENSEMEDFIASDGHVSYEDDISAPAQTEQGAGSNDHDNTSVKDVFNGYEDGGQTACGEASYDGQNVFHSSSEPFTPKRLRRNRVASQADKQSSVASGRGKLGLSVDSSDDDDHGSGYNSFTTPKRRLRPSKSSFSAERMAENKALDTAEEVNADYQPAGGNDHQPQTPGRYHLRTRTNKQPESAKRTFLRTPFKRRIESSDSDNQESSARPQTSRRMKVAPKRVESAGRDPRPGDSPKDPNGTESEDTWDTKPLLRRPGCSSGRLSLVEIASSSRPRLRSYSQVGPAGNHTASTESSSKEKMTYNKKLKRGIPREWLWR